MSATDQDSVNDNAEENANDAQSSSQPEGERITLGKPQKPIMKMNNVLSTADSLRSRLDSFMPQLAESNQGLNAEQNMEATDCPDDREHIALELACGVLEERTAQPSDAASRSDVTIPLPSMRNGNSESTTSPHLPAMMLPTPSATGSSASSDDMSEDDDDSEDDDGDDDDDEEEGSSDDESGSRIGSF
jgi:hypothetical protein